MASIEREQGRDKAPSRQQAAMTHSGSRAAAFHGADARLHALPRTAIAILNIQFIRRLI
jgi:hypothetical protein